MGYGYISSGSGAGIFEVGNQVVWRQFQLKLDWVTRRRLIAAALSPSLVATAEVKYSSRKIALKTVRDGEKKHDT